MKSNLKANLYDCRSNDFRYILSCNIPGQKTIKMCMNTNFATHAYLETFSEVEATEMFGLRPFGSINILIVEWFLSIEAFLHDLYKIMLIMNVENQNERKNQFKKFQNNYFLKKFDVLINCSSVKTQNDKLRSEVDDLCTLRNEIIHNRLFETSNLEYKSAKFYPNIHFLNIGDLMQACIIAINVFQFFKDFFPNIDMVPSIPYMDFSSGRTIYFKITHLYDKVLKPSFERAIEKHNIYSSIDLPLISESLKPIGKSTNVKFKLVIKDENPSPLYKPNSNWKKTHCEALMHKLISKDDTPSGAMKQPKYNDVHI